MKIGYVRVSKPGQKIRSQVDILLAYGVKQENIYSEVYTGTTRNRPKFNEVMNEVLRPGDTLVITRLARIGRSLSDLIKIVNELKEREIEFVCVKDNIDTSTAVGKLMFHIFGAIAEFERDLLSERTRDGIAAARKRGKIPGRKKGATKVDLDLFKVHYQSFDDHYKGIDGCIERFGIARTTCYKYLNKLGIKYPAKGRPFGK